MYENIITSLFMSDGLSEISILGNLIYLTVKLCVTNQVELFSNTFMKSHVDWFVLL